MRRFLFCPFAFGACLISFAGLAAAQAAQRATASGPARGGRPHIILFIADDHSWHDCGAYGAGDVRTPHLDRLAGQSVRFDLAFAASPTCTPSRSAIYTGLYPFRNGAHANHSLVKDGLRTLPHYLKDLGYRVVLAGKTHIGPRAVFPFEYLEHSNIMPPGRNHILWTDLNTGAIDNLLSKHDPAQPLCLIVCSHSPHVFWMENDGYDPMKIHLPPYLLDTPETRSARCRYYTDVSWMDRQVGDVLQALAKHGYEDRSLVMFTADQGAQWPFAKWNLYDAGIRTPLLVRWPGRCRPGTTTRAMVSLIDLLPTMIEAAGGTPSPDMDGKSFLPVVLGKTDHHRDAVFASHTGDGAMNRCPMRCIRTERHKYIVNLAPETPYVTHIDNSPDRDNYWVSWLELAKRDAEAARVVRRYQRRPAEELYDIQADPFEMKNLADDPAQADVLSELREKVRQWRLQQGEDLNKVAMPEDARHGQLRYAG